MFFGNALDGWYLLCYEEKNWFLVKDKIRQQVERFFNRYGILSVLFTWLPVVGDGITLLSGVLCVPNLVFIGKAMRYALTLCGQHLLPLV